jgi:hypothetical protein
VQFFVSKRFGFPGKGNSSSDRADEVRVSGIESTHPLKSSYIQPKKIDKQWLKLILDKVSTQLDENASFQRSIGGASILDFTEI